MWRWLLWLFAGPTVIAVSLIVLIVAPTKYAAAYAYPAALLLCIAAARIAIGILWFIGNVYTSVKDARYPFWWPATWIGAVGYMLVLAFIEPWLSAGFLANAVTVLLAGFLLLRNVRTYQVVTGAAIGAAAYLVALLALGGYPTPLGSIVTIVWCVANAIVCLLLASWLELNAPDVA